MGTETFCKRVTGGGVWSKDRASTSHMDCLPLLPPAALLQAAGHCTPVSRLPSSRPPATEHLSRRGRGPKGRSNLGPEGDGEQEVPILHRSNSPSSNPPSQPPSGGAGPRSREGRPGSATPHPGPEPKVHAGRARRLLGATPPGPPSPPGSDRESTPRATRSDRSPNRDVARAPREPRATLRSQISAEPALPPSRLAHCGSGRATPPPDGHYLGRNS